MTTTIADTVKDGTLAGDGAATVRFTPSAVRDASDSSGIVGRKPKNATVNQTTGAFTIDLDPGVWDVRIKTGPPGEKPVEGTILVPDTEDTLRLWPLIEAYVPPANATVYGSTLSAASDAAVAAFVEGSGPTAAALSATYVRPTDTVLTNKAPLASPAFTGTPTGITKSHVGLGNVDNTTDANKPVSTAAQTALNAKVGKADLFLNARDYGVLGNGTDETTAITALFAAALTLNSVAGAVSGTTYRTPTIYFPAGTYSWTTKITADLAVSSTANRDRRRLILQGDGEGATVFKPTYTSDAALHVKGGLFTMTGIRWIGTGSNSFVKFGDPVAGTSYVNQFKIDHCSFHNGGDMWIFDWCFDGAFQDCQFSSVAASKTGFLVNQHADDNSNNISFIRCHWEPSGAGTTYFKVRGGALASQKHSQYNFVSCHFETRRYNCTAFDIEDANAFNFLGTRFAQNQDTAATTAPTDALPLFRLVNMNGFAMTDCVVARVASSTTDTWLNKLFSVGGSARAIRANGTFFAPYTTSSTEAKVTLWQSDATTAYIPDGTSVIEFGEGNSIGSRTAPKVSDDALTITSANARNRNWTGMIDDNNAQMLRFYYSNDATTLTSSSAYKLGLGTDGVLSLRNGLAAATASTIANNATAAYDLAGNNNGSKRALYIVTARTTSEHTWALVYSSGTALDTIAVGSDMAVGTSNPATAGKFNVYLNGSILTVNNLFGSSALVSCIPIGF